jgi:hypothetical protein
MPEMTGLDFHARLQIEDPVQARRVVLMSGGFARLAGDPPLALPRPLLEKPFRIEQVLALMRESMLGEPLAPA